MSSTVSPTPTAGPVPAPRSRKSRGPGLHPEMVGWLFMRLSGVLLVALSSAMAPHSVQTDNVDPVTQGSKVKMVKVPSTSTTNDAV